MIFSVGQVVYKKEFGYQYLDVLDIRRRHGTFYKIKEIHEKTVLIKCIKYGRKKIIPLYSLKTYKTLKKD